MTASRESSRTNVTVLCAKAEVADGPLPFDGTNVMNPPATVTFEFAALSTPRTSTEPSVVPIVVEPDGSTRTVNAVPVTVAVAVGVVTA
jgi:hypothetical protein